MTEGTTTIEVTCHKCKEPAKLILTPKDTAILEATKPGGSYRHISKWLVVKNKDNNQKWYCPNHAKTFLAERRAKLNTSPPPKPPEPVTPAVVEDEGVEDGLGYHRADHIDPRPPRRVTVKEGSAVTLCVPIGGGGKHYVKHESEVIIHEETINHPHDLEALQNEIRARVKQDIQRAFTEDGVRQQLPGWKKKDPERR